MKETKLKVLMREFDSAIKTLYPSRVYFFPSNASNYRSRSWLVETFRRLWKQVNDAPARAYELRHNYVVTNINRLLDAGMSFEDSLTYISKSLGHTSTAITCKYYYSLVPLLADIIKEHSEEGFNELLPEVISV